MAETLVGVAALRATFGEVFAVLRDTIKDVVHKVRMFKPILKRLESKLDRLAPIIKDVKQLDCPKGKETWGLIKQMKKGEKLVPKLLEIRWWSFYLKVNFSVKLQELEDSIVRFCLVDLQILKNIRAQIWKTVQMLCPGLKFKGNSISFFFCP